MIKKTAALALLISLITPSLARADEVEHPFSEFGDKKRVALNVIGVGGAITACGAVFLFVGRSGAALHLNPDGSLKVRGLLEEAQAATSLQRVSFGVLLVGIATTITGTVMLLLARRRTVSFAPFVTHDAQGFMVLGEF
ncbi:MAG: hypothetical protein GQE15_04910 [Archangiaceae bacterium]|nr:hypothetical protein [Archangiaceae bacterium]